MIRKKFGGLLFLFFLLFGCAPEKSPVGVVIRLPQDPESLNPVQYSNVAATQLLSLLYQSLLVIDLESKEYKPLLVKEMPKPRIAGNQTFYDFNLREEAAWDNGQPITGADVALSLKVIHSPGLRNQRLKSFFEFIRDVQLYPGDPKKFTLVLGEFNPTEILQIEQFAVLPAYLVDPKGLLQKFSYRQLALSGDSLAQNPALIAFADWFNSDRFTRNPEFLKGSGGYVLEKWETGQFVRFQKKATWWGDEVKPAQSFITAHPSQITFQILPDNATALLALKSGKLDVFSDVPAAAYKQLAADAAFKKNYQLFTPEIYDFTYIGLNGRLGKFADPRTRQAIAHLLDVDKIMQTTQGGFATRTVGPINPSDTKFYHAGLKPFVFDGQQSVKLLQAAGWQKEADGFYKTINGKREKLQVTLNYKAGNSEFETISLVFQQAAAKINIPVVIQPLEGMLLTNNLKEHNFEMFIRYLTGNRFFFNFKPILHTESAVPGGGNYSGFGTPESDRIIDQINEADADGEKAQLLKKLQQHLYDQSNLIFLYFNKDRLAVHNRFTNLKVSGIKPNYDVSAFTLKSE